jgi:hypothetical protein
MNPDPQLSEADLAEARRIAAELVKLHAAGVIEDAEDPEASFYAYFIRSFGATELAFLVRQTSPETKCNAAWRTQRGDKNPVCGDVARSRCES